MDIGKESAGHKLSGLSLTPVFTNKEIFTFYWEEAKKDFLRIHIGFKEKLWLDRRTIKIYFFCWESAMAKSLFVFWHIC